MSGARIGYLGERANEGQLADGERAEYHAYVRTITYISPLQSKARKLLRNDDEP
jgi:hypothetical protein